MMVPMGGSGYYRADRGAADDAGVRHWNQSE